MQSNDAATAEVSRRSIATDAFPVSFAIHRDVAAIEELWRGFEDLAAGHVFQCFEFAHTWIKTVGRARGSRPLIIIGRDQDANIVCLLPFAVRRRLGRRWVSWIGEEHADYQGGLFHPALLRELAFDDDAHKRFRADIEDLLRAHADLKHLSRQPISIDGWRNPFVGDTPIRHSDASHQTYLGSDWKAYYRGKRNANSRRNDKSKIRNLTRQGELQYFDAASETEVDRVLAAMFQQKKKMLTRNGIADMFARKGAKAFYASLARQSFPRGLVHVAAVELNGHIIATNWGLVRDDRYYYVMHSYDDHASVARSSPGRLLMYHIMRWCIDRDIELFDFTIGDETFKNQWCEASQGLYDDVVALRAIGIDHAVALRCGKALKRIFKSFPALWRTTSRLRRAASRAVTSIGHQAGRSGRRAMPSPHQRSARSVSHLTPGE